MNGLKTQKLFVRKMTPSISEPGTHLKWRIKLIAKQLKEGAVIAYPTEGVWGLGCLPEMEAPVRRILDLKRRSWKQGLILVASNFEYVKRYVGNLSEREEQFLINSWPQHTTYLLPSSSLVPSWIKGDNTKVAIRISQHPIIQAISDKLESPLVSTSANPTGKPSAMNILRLKQYFPVGIDYIVPGSIGDNKGASKIVDFKSSALLRGSKE